MNGVKGYVGIQAQQLHQVSSQLLFRYGPDSLGPFTNAVLRCKFPLLKECKCLWLGVVLLTEHKYFFPSIGTVKTSSKLAQDILIRS